MAGVKFNNVHKKFGDQTVVRDLSCEINDREFVVIVGPSGCGKSTSLRMIAGLESISQGTIEIGNRVINDLPPKDRDIAMVFQNYALYPHMNVYNNMGFGLRLRKFPKPEIEKRVLSAADILGIRELLDRKPKQLSGGQRQRVAVGRAIVREPSVFLFDEPLSNLDAKLRVQMRSEIRKLHLKLRATMIYVTHDQVEAMTMGDRIVILKDGILQQEGPPMDIYRHPTNLFVASFIGSPSMNILSCNVDFSNENPVLESSDTRIPLSADCAEDYELDGISKVAFGIRPENLFIKPPSDDPEKIGQFKGKVELVETTGSESLVHFNIASSSYVARISTEFDIQINQQISLYFDLRKIHLFSEETQENLCRK